MKFDPIILGMVRSDVEIVMAICIEDHLRCECVDRTNITAWADHLADKVAEILEIPPDIDGSYARFAQDILERGRRMDVQK